MNSNSEDAWSRNGCGPCKNLCLGIDQTNRPVIQHNSMKIHIPPADYFRYVGIDGTNQFAPKFASARPSVPSGHVEKS